MKYGCACALRRHEIRHMSILPIQYHTVQGSLCDLQDLYDDIRTLERFAKRYMWNPHYPREAAALRFNAKRLEERLAPYVLW